MNSIYVMLTTRSLLLQVWEDRMLTNPKQSDNMDIGHLASGALSFTIAHMSHMIPTRVLISWFRVYVARMLPGFFANNFKADLMASFTMVFEMMPESCSITSFRSITCLSNQGMNCHWTTNVTEKQTVWLMSSDNPYKRYRAYRKQTRMHAKQHWFGCLKAESMCKHCSKLDSILEQRLCKLHNFESLTCSTRSI